MAGDDAGEGMLARAMRVLHCFSDDEPALTAAELARRRGSRPPRCTGCSRS